MDLATLWYLTIGTLLVAAAMTLWERQEQLQRSRELGLWASAYGVFALGCVLAMNRQLLPGVAGSALTNVVMVTGYILVLQGISALDGGRPRPLPVAAFLAALAAAWFAAGTKFENMFWSHVGALPIAVICALAALALARSRAARGLRSRPIAIAVFACHSLFYGARALAVPVVAAIFGDGVLPVVAKATMYEAVLFTVAMPMALIALVREEDRARLLASARTDFLTGLNNRQGFFELGPHRLTRDRRGAPHSLLAFDLDLFKAINDRYGHQAGDRILALFAQVAKAAAGPGAMGARLGGEEFAFLLPGLGAQDARRVGEEIARAFAEAAARADGLAIPATVSVGVAEAGAGESDLAALLAAADRALYKAKLLGRNRIEIAQPERTFESAPAG
ncbi:GGDEF domain-containing protein [Bosea sp. CS1GBMeth4]|uniref:GGDEF domain-containing protein n=1 Tax=Bosea sp. CS1GBMeth4 TaxID=1892849 RepID=UPI001648CBE1|nr:GGDEF domain-containing protein [Bosea sp. CS1GBMeth4]